ncbi:MAG TPA: hypothetical protein VHO47_03410 [Candidatus Babeliales bacterium]|nr:hypothetical protein [Candidatus Babeliales bacterium]
MKKFLSLAILISLNASFYAMENIFRGENVNCEWFIASTGNQIIMASCFWENKTFFAISKSNNEEFDEKTLSNPENIFNELKKEFHRRTQLSKTARKS